MGLYGIISAMKLSVTILLIATLASRCTFASVVLTNAAAVANAVTEQKRSGERFDFKAQIVTRFGDPVRSVIAGDDTGFILVHLEDGMNAVPESGDHVSLQGMLCRVTEDTIVAYATNLTVHSHGKAPPPIDATHEDIYSGRLAYGIVRLRGVVIDVFQDEADSRFSFLVLSVDGKPIGLPSSGVPYERLARLIGAEISVVGPCSAYCGHGPRAKLEYEVYIENESDVTIITPPPADPFAVPGFKGNVYPIIFPKPGDSMRRKLVGYVEAVADRRILYVRAPNGELSSVRLLTSGSLPDPGDTIEAVGIAETDFYSLNLSRAIWRHAAEPLAVTVTKPIEKSIRDVFHDPVRGSRFNAGLIGRVLRVRGKIVDLKPTTDAQGTFLLCDDGTNLSVDATSVPHALDSLEVGCVVEVSGLCVAETENWRPQSPFPHINQMSLILRTPDDVVILDRPPWWTPVRLRLAILILVAMILLFVAYSVFLIRIIHRRNEDLNREQQIHERTEIRRFERTRLAIELHDSLVQILTGTAMELETARGVATTDPAMMSAHLDIAKKALQSCREELRNSIWDLRSDALEEETLEGSILRTLTPHVNRARVAVKFAARREILSDNTCHAVIKIIRELTINATNHGHANLVRIAGKVEDGKLYFSVIDDGTGFDIDNRPGVLEGHFGLQGVKERVNSLGGTFSLVSSPGHGTKARVTIPLDTKMT